MPEVSVVLPSYNDAEHLAGAIQRLLEQQDVDLEVIVVDDGSRDASPELARAAADRDQRVRAILLPANGGVARARERGVSEATGEYVWFVDSDDAWEPGAACALLQAARAERADVVVAGAVFRYADGTSRDLAAPISVAVDGRTALEMGLTGRITGHLWNKLFRREVMASVPAVPSRTQSDLPYVLGALARASRVTFLDRKVYEYRLRPGSIITSTRQRADCLAAIDEAVSATVAELAPNLVGSPALRYFQTRYVVLSGLKDAELGGYPEERRRQLRASLRQRLTPGAFVSLARQRDPQRLAMAAAAVCGPAVHRRVIGAAHR
ncbi:Glycosyltransferase involved in cell wall bisynthesis [Quadrisphaera granulorum]|uniref:Glycosyltransferase involved in cell wall biosynthesis n=1 Tax=Quadrisphaera granulorum TaxID=317664 RepID=A0A315ZVH6_9ACTN|nr:glycosyltransferase family 2 protein [Quadrisphaera granulorum]PWJ48634.1 glycosyltransferase involved in cell wall biosynthesis [Quadrisphaera granulorum]SZE98356.1 Glycosyltransferase involved in cell wall bisynthesis [Quadrisphaera granulorum]